MLSSGADGPLRYVNGPFLQDPFRLGMGLVYHLVVSFPLGMGHPFVPDGRWTKGVPASCQFGFPLILHNGSHHRSIMGFGLGDGLWAIDNFVLLFDLGLDNRFFDGTADLAVDDSCLWVCKETSLSDGLSRYRREAGCYSGQRDEAVDNP